MNILITGAAGSLGRAFIRYLVKDNYVIALDNAEWGIAELDNEYADNKNIMTMLSDFSEWKYNQNPVDLVIHCAAYKHLPLGEKKQNRNSFLDNNVVKTRKLFAECYKNNADFIFISSDKAVEPCNFYGYTKSIGEGIAESFDGYIARCGNFLNSSGSVIPVWEKCILEGKPLPITDLNMRRFVIDVDDAVKQIMEGYGEGKHLIIPECEEVSLAELAAAVLQKHDKVYGHYPIEIIGIRQGEKLREKLQ